MSLFYDNHDNPRMVSKVDPDLSFRDVLAKLLAVMQLTLRGTPFIYQGQELGMVNQKFASISELRDVESINLYQELRKTMEEGKAFQKILAGTRDHSRTPIQWSSTRYAGFSDHEPWIGMDNDYKTCNVEQQKTDEDSVLNFYRRLIAIRKEHAALIYGDIQIANKKVHDLFTYYRTGQHETFYIECNLGRKFIKRKGSLPNGIRLIANYQEVSESELKPYEAAVWLFNYSCKWRKMI
jgi:oligo-1,6-glucosidase